MARGQPGHGTGLWRLMGRGSKPRGASLSHPYPDPRHIAATSLRRSRWECTQHLTQTSAHCVPRQSIWHFICHKRKAGEQPAEPMFLESITISPQKFWTHKGMAVACSELTLPARNGGLESLPFLHGAQVGWGCLAGDRLRPRPPQFKINPERAPGRNSRCMGGW